MLPDNPTMTGGWSHIELLGELESEPRGVEVGARANHTALGQP